MFYNRIEAAIMLASRLRKYKDNQCVVLAIPKGGIPLGCIIARELEFPLDIVLTKKMKHPTQKENTIGDVCLTERFIIPQNDVPLSYIEKETNLIREDIKRIYTKYMGNKQPVELKDKVVIIVDDGIATGNTLLTTIKMVRKSNPSRIVIAIPVASSESIDKLKGLVDEIVCLKVPADFSSIDSFYKNFEVVSDEEIFSYLKLEDKKMESI